MIMSGYLLPGEVYFGLQELISVPDSFLFRHNYISVKNILCEMYHAIETIRTRYRFQKNGDFFTKPPEAGYPSNDKYFILLFGSALYRG